MPSLTPMYSLGANSSRTQASILASNTRSHTGSQGRIYAWMKNKGQGDAYYKFLYEVLYGPNTGR